MEHEHPMQLTYLTARTAVNLLLTFVFQLESAWASLEHGPRLITGSVSSLVDQLVRSATSVTANMQEGFGKASRESLTVFLRIARGSLYEVVDHLESIKLLVCSFVPVTEQMDVLYKSWKVLQDQFDEEFTNYTKDSVRFIEMTLEPTDQNRQDQQDPEMPESSRTSGSSGSFELPELCRKTPETMIIVQDCNRKKRKLFDK